MKKEIKYLSLGDTQHIIDKENKIVRITTLDERFYGKETQNKETGLPEYEFKPSVSWIAGCYPKGVPFYQWLAKHGWDEAEAIKIERGESGSKVHQACEELALGNTVSFNDKFINPNTGKEEELTPDEYQAVMSFRAWYDTLVDPKVVLVEFVIWADKYAGSGDLVVEHGEKENRQTTLIDLKTSQYIWESHKIQLNAYFHAPIGVKFTNQAILQIGYKRNKSLYKFTEIEPEMDTFDIAYRIWEKEHGKKSPRQIDLPLEIEAIKVEQNIK